jgi:DNA polymerase-3 subunit delta'
MIGPEGASIGIDQVRRLNAAVSRKPYNHRHVVVIDAADVCTDQAQNAFLKTLEEPPGAAVFILVSDRPEALLPTVLSRCCEVKFRRLGVDLVAEELVQRHDVPAVEAKAAAALAGGSIGRALELHTPAAAALREKVLAVAANPALARVNDKTLFAGRAEARQWLDFMSLWYRDLLLYRLTGNTGLIVNTDRLQEIKQAAYTASQLLKAVESVETGQKMLRANVHQRLVMEGLTARLASVFQKDSSRA